MAIGLAGGAFALAAAAAEPTIPVRWLLLFLAGASSAAIHAASGRLILGWFEPLERGRAMGIRQMGQPIGVAVSALVIPALATGGASRALLVLAGACLAAAIVIAAVVRDPARPAGLGASGSDGSPYRTPTCGASTQRARCSSSHSSRSRSSRSTSSSRLSPGRRRSPVQPSRSVSSWAQRAVSGQDGGPTGSAIVCGRCASWRS